jgi:hypothetical protein
MAEAKNTKIAPKAAIKAKTSPKIYIGPNLLQMIKYTVLSNEIPVHVQSLIDKCPAVEKLIVEINDLAEKESKIAKKGTLEHRYYQEIIDYANKARKGDQ